MTDLKTSQHTPQPTSDATLLSDKFSWLVHVHELRRRFIWVALAFLAITLGAYLVADTLYAFLVAPLAEIEQMGDRRLIYTHMGEAFYAYLRLAVTVGIWGSLPILLWQIWRFIAPGLHPHERKAVRPFLVMVPIMLLAGMAAAYYGVIPLAWRFFMGFEGTLTTPSGTAMPIMLEARVGDYLDLTLTLLTAFGFACQFPLLLGVLVRLGIITAKHLSYARRYVYLGILVTAAFITPPDIISQMMMTLPLVFLYEVTILCARLKRSPTSTVSD